MSQNHIVWFFHRAKIKSNNLSVIVSNNSLIQVRHTEFLRVIIDDQPKWTNHAYIAYVKSKISKGMGINLPRARKYLSQTVLLNLYHAI